MHLTVPLKMCVSAVKLIVSHYVFTVVLKKCPSIFNRVIKKWKVVVFETACMMYAGCV